MNRKAGDEIRFVTRRLKDDTGKTYIRIELVVADKDYRHSFLVHFRRKGKSQWQTSPMIKNSNVIDMHGLDVNCIYEIRVAVISAAKDVSTFEDIDESAEDSVISKINLSNKQKYLSKRVNYCKHIDKFATDFAQQVVSAVIDTIRNSDQ